MKNRWFTKRIFIFVLLFAGFISYSSAQEWKNNLPQNKAKNHTLTLKDYQKAFYSYFKEAKVGETKGTKENKVKDETWEKFKRWEWYWETRVNPVSGAFPRTTAFDVYQQYLKTHSNTTNQNSQPWISKGPVKSAGGYAGLGRINSVAFSPVDTNVLYVGSAAGGVWKTTDGGSDWTPLGDFNKSLGVSDIVVVNEGGDDIIYLATGDRDHFDTRSVGVLKSTDGGQSWYTTGLQWEPRQGNVVFRLLIDPEDNSILYATTNNGLYKTTDAGQNWNIINNLPFRDLEFQPGSNTRMYGASAQDGAIYYSEDAGQTWTKAIDNADNRWTELAVTADSANVVYAVMANANGGLLGIYRSKDAGQTYVLVFNKLNLLGSGYGFDSGGQGWYDLSIAVDPHDANKVFVGGINTWMSEDGGKSWKLSSYWKYSFNGQNNDVVHADKHELVYQSSTNALFECNDGGIYKKDYGKHWSYIGSGIIVSQIYRLGTSATVKGEVITGLQDNGTKLLSGNNWSDVLDGDGMESLIDYTDNNTQYGEYTNGQIYRTKDHWQSPGTKINSGLWGNAAWVTPYVINPINHKTLYVGYQDVFKSTDQGDNWVKLSYWGGETLQSIAVSASDTNYIYAATFNIIYKTADGGKTWSDITANLPQAQITYVTIKDNDPNTVWVTMGGYNNLGVFETANGGNSWHNISSGLPAIPVNSITQNKLHGSTELFAGTDVGVFVRKGNSGWQPFNSQLPNVVIDELEIHYDSLKSATLYAATYGRGLWSVDISHEINGSSNIPQNILLGKGWNIISFNITPDSLNMLSMLQPFIKRNELVKVIDEKGNFIQDISGTGWVNTIGDMDNTEGYYIKVTDEDILKESGRLVTLPFGISLEKGWNIIGYPLQSGQGAKAALQTLIDSSYFVKAIDESGGFIQYISGIGWMNTIGNFEPGEGYYVKVSRNTH
ncbi:MAG: hypothetical protein GXO86_09420, partial [Chlorobi bacterium]|nr:hypothetical protein [Chlorobiota bacterium]